MGGNIETERTKPKRRRECLTFSLARAKAQREPAESDRSVVERATMALFMMVPIKGREWKSEA
jgi:hypothetical protein